MYYPRNFRLADAVKLAGLVQMAYEQRHAAEEGTPWSLPSRLELLGELTYTTKLARPTSLRHPLTGAAVPSGYVAREAGTLYVIFRGTETPEEWVRNLQVTLVPYEGYGNVHAGFHQRYASFRDRVLALAGASRDKIVCAGHSLGASYATFAAIEIERVLKKKVSALYTFASPRIGDGAFADAFNRDFGGRSFRVVNTSDVVPSLPPPCPVFAFGGYFSHGDTPVDFTVQKNGIRDNHGIGTYLEYLSAQKPKGWF